MLLLFLLAAAQAPVPTTVNGDTLGTAEQFETSGPAKVCLREMAIHPKAGEKVYLKYAGIHSGTLTLVSNNKSVDFDHGEIWKAPRRKGKLIDKAGQVEIFRTKRSGGLAYSVWVPSEDYEGQSKQKPIVWISGSLLNGSANDRQILRKLEVKLNSHEGCNRTYAYGWDMLFGDEPLDTKESQ